MLRFGLLVQVALSMLVSIPAMLCAQERKYSYPSSRVDRVVEKLHGVEIADPYRWLEDGNNPEVKEWVTRQNVLTRSVLDQVLGRTVIQRRLETLMEIGTLGTPLPRRGRYFYTRRIGKQNQPILHVREGLRGTDRVLLDPNRLAADGTVALDWWYPSRDGILLAYGLSQNGSEESTLHVLDVETGQALTDVIDRTRACSLAWLPDRSGFYYTRYPAANSVKKGEEHYHRHIFFHRLGTTATEDKKVFGEDRLAEDWPEVALSPDGRWLVITVQQGWSRSEVFFQDRLRAGTGFVPLVERVEALFSVVPRNDRFYVHTNDGAPRYRLFRVNPLQPSRAHWKEIIAEGPDVFEGLAAIGDTLVCQFLHKASSRLRLFDRDGTFRREVDLPMLGSISGLGGEWDGNEVLFGFQSFTVPPRVYQVDLTGGPTQLWEQLKADIDFSAYQVEQVTYPSADLGRTPITLFLAHRKGLTQSGKTPTLLYGYGGFNISITPTFNAARFLFLEQGGLLAIANLRGGGEYGEKWHQEGMLGKKQNVIDDFLGAAEWLIAQKYTAAKHLAIQGGSNGGLLVGAALTQRPDLFRAVVCQVPLLDMVRYHKFLIARLWIPEYGSADDPEGFRWLFAYSPYHRVKEGTPYPAVLLATAESDTRVDTLHARKMAARLQAATTSDHPVLLRLESKAGHGAGKPRTKIVEELTDVWSFLFWQLGIVAEPRPSGSGGSPSSAP
jgi:prolyl oligopeptidase